MGQILYNVSQESQPGFRNWVPKIGNCTIIWPPIFKGKPQYIQTVTINVYSFIKIRYDILIQSNGNYIEVRKKSIICWKVTFYEITFYVLGNDV